MADERSALDAEPVLDYSDDYVDKEDLCLADGDDEGSSGDSGDETPEQQDAQPAALTLESTEAIANVTSQMAAQLREIQQEMERIKQQMHGGDELQSLAAEIESLRRRVSDEAQGDTRARPRPSNPRARTEHPSMAPSRRTAPAQPSRLWIRIGYSVLTAAILLGGPLRSVTAHLVAALAERGATTWAWDHRWSSTSASSRPWYDEVMDDDDDPDSVS